MKNFVVPIIYYIFANVSHADGYRRISIVLIVGQVMGMNPRFFFFLSNNMSLFMFIKNKFVSLCKGQNQGESSPYSNVLKNIMSPCSVQNRVSPDYVSISCADKSMDLMMQLLKNKLTRSISSESLMVSL